MVVIGELYNRPELINPILPEAYRGLALSLCGILFVGLKYAEAIRDKDE